MVKTPEQYDETPERPWDRPRKLTAEQQRVAAEQARLPMGAFGVCWCGETYQHDWPGKDNGVPHPRQTLEEAMICTPCRKGQHLRCPELARQDDAGLNATEKSGSVLCDCRHYVPGQLVTEP